MRRREAARRAAANEREHKRLYVESRKAEAAMLIYQVLRQRMLVTLARPSGATQ
jgi:hypothetical protein